MPIDRIRDLKTSAKNQRDGGLDGYPSALEMLGDAIELARNELATSTVAERRIEMATELSDCFGLVGGVQRRWADEADDSARDQHLKEAASAYDQGFVYESDPAFGIVNSYNLVNRLVVRVLLAPQALTSDEPMHLPGIAPLKLRDELGNAVTTVRGQLAGPRRGDYWALADLALLEVLSGRTGAATAYVDFLALSPPDFAYESVLGGLRPLAELPIVTAPELNAAVELLQGRLDELVA
ncbi:Caspase family protein OS=Rhizobacter sp. AJA081-3 OX=2753607 GN=HZ992_24855 PE=4 SV=1 [Rhizobacter fulvus]|jgi:hypothetical protein